MISVSLIHKQHMEHKMMRFAFLSFKAVTHAALMTLALAAPWAQAQNKMVFTSLADLDKCAAQYRYDTGYCMDALEAYAAKRPNELFEIGKRARLHFVHRAALRFFEPALKKPTPAQCADEDLGLAVISGFGSPTGRDDEKRAAQIFSGSCFEALRPAIEKEVAASNEASYTHKNACAVLVAKGAKSAACSPKITAAAATPAPVEPTVKLATIDKAKANLGLIKVYAGSEGERLTMADVKDSPGTYLIRIDGVRSPVNGKTFVHQEEILGSNTRYWTEHDGKRWNTVFVQGGGSYKRYTVFIPGVKDELNVSFSESATQAAKPESLR
jgi:hypothetical protein